MKLPLNALRAFATVYAEGGVRAAARELGIAHSSVSRHLAELDAWLGVRLIEAPTMEGRRGIAFTAQGQALGKAVAASFREIENAVAALREARSAHSVTISTTPSFAARWLLPRLPALSRSHPRIEVSVLMDQKLDDPEAAGIDLAIRIGRGPWPDVRCEVLMHDWLYPVVGAQSYATGGRPERLEDLLTMRLLHDRDPQATWDAWRRVHGPATLDVRTGPRFTSSDLVLRAAAQGQGVALARHQLARADVANGVLAKPFGDRVVALGPAYWLVLPSRARLRGSVAAVLEWIRAQAKQDQ